MVHTGFGHEAEQLLGGQRLATASPGGQHAAEAGSYRIARPIAGEYVSTRVDDLRHPSTPSRIPATGCPRSEEHTSELQSHSDLVCRLLLEKKKNKESTKTKTSRSQHSSQHHTA